MTTTNNHEQAPVTNPLGKALISLPARAERAKGEKPQVEQEGQVYIALYRKDAKRTVNGVEDPTFATITTSDGQVDLRGNYEEVCDALGLDPNGRQTKAIIGASLPKLISLAVRGAQKAK